MSSVDTKSRPVAVSCASGLVALAFHLLLLTPVLMGFSASTKPSKIDSNELETSAGNDALSASMTVTFIDESDLGARSQADQANNRLAAYGPPLKIVLPPTPEPKFSLPPDDADT